MAAHGLLSLYDGAFGAWAANLAGHYPWFATYNALQRAVPEPRESASQVPGS